MSGEFFFCATCPKSYPRFTDFVAHRMAAHPSPLTEERCALLDSRKAYIPVALCRARTNEGHLCRGKATVNGKLCRTHAGLRLLEMVEKREAARAN